MNVIKAKQRDISAVIAILDESKKIMQETGNTSQWNENYPSQTMIQTDIDNDNGFLCVESGEIVGYFCFLQGNAPDPNYHQIEGAWLNQRPYGVIHRLGSNRKAKGVAQCAFAYAFSKIDTVRVDTHRENHPMQRFLKKQGFSICGVIHVSDGSPRDAFQKTIPL